MIPWHSKSTQPQVLLENVKCNLEFVYTSETLHASACTVSRCIPRETHTHTHLLSCFRLLTPLASTYARSLSKGGKLGSVFNLLYLAFKSCSCLAVAAIVGVLRVCNVTQMQGGTALWCCQGKCPLYFARGLANIAGVMRLMINAQSS